MIPSEHPGRETLWRFGLGRLNRKGMVTIEGHIRQCPRCGRIALRAPDDRLVTLLRATAAGRVTGTAHAKGPPRTPGMIVLLFCLAGVLGSSIAGCSGGHTAAAFSPADQARAKESFKKRFAGGAEKQTYRKASP
jgi:hypothetical protein